MPQLSREEITQVMDRNRESALRLIDRMPNELLNNRPPAIAHACFHVSDLLEKSALELMVMFAKLGLYGVSDFGTKFVVKYRAFGLGKKIVPLFADVNAQEHTAVRLSCQIDWATPGAIHTNGFFDVVVGQEPAIDQLLAIAIHLRNELISFEDAVEMSKCVDITDFRGYGDGPYLLQWILDRAE